VVSLSVERNLGLSIVLAEFVVMRHTVNILVADDSRATQQIVMNAVRVTRVPLSISATDNGRDCATLLRSGHVDLAFIDVQMPELSGPEVLWNVRQQGLKTFVTLMSTPPCDEAIEMARKLKAYEFLFKPFAVTEVQAILKTYCRIASPTKVLIVDDSSTVRRVVQKVIQRSVFNCEIAEAANGKDAINICRKERFEVAFLDYNMPGLGGLETMKTLLLIQPDLQIVMISAEDDVALGNQARDNGACAFLHKPFYPPDIDRVLHIAFGLRSPELAIEGGQPDFDVSIEGRTIRLMHKLTGHIFEYLWFRTTPYLRNCVIRPALACAVAPKEIVTAVEKAALIQLSAAQLIDGTAW
jgi:CheY-like chemotaxis protein